MGRKNGLTSTHAEKPRRGFENDYYVAYDRWVFGNLIEAGPVALNLVSSGKVLRGRPVPTPEVLKHLPKKPPGR